MHRLKLPERSNILLFFDWIFRDLKEFNKEFKNHFSPLLRSETHHKTIASKLHAWPISIDWKIRLTPNIFEREELPCRIFSTLRNQSLYCLPSLLRTEMWTSIGRRVLRSLKIYLLSRARLTVDDSRLILRQLRSSKRWKFPKPVMHAYIS